MIDGSILGEIDLLAFEHVIAELLDSSFLRKVYQQPESLFGDEVLAEVEEDLGLVGGVVEGTGEFLEAFRIRLEELPQDNITAEGFMVSLELLPC